MSDVAAGLRVEGLGAVGSGVRSAGSDVPGVELRAGRLGGRGAGGSVGGGEGSFAARFEEAREAAGELVANAFVKPVLSELRASTMAAEPFKPGMWEKRFGPIVDGMVAEELVGKEGWGLVDVMAERFVGLARASERGKAMVAMKRAG